jgi:hypothetical protein
MDVLIRLIMTGMKLEIGSVPPFLGLFSMLFFGYGGFNCNLLLLEP